MKLDPATLILVSALTGLTLPFFLLGLSRSKETGAAVRLWTRATFIYAAGLLCLLLRNTLPDVLSIAVGNVLLLLGYAELYQGFRVFFGRAPSRKLQWAAASVYLLGLLFYLNGPQAFEMRVILASVFLGAGSAAIARELLQVGYRFRKQSNATQANEHFVFFAFGFAFFANAVFLLARGTVFSYRVAIGGGVGGDDFFYALSFLIAIFVHLILAAGLPLLLSRRTQRELVAREASLLKVQQVGRLAYAWLDTHTNIITTNSVLRDVLGIPSDLEITLDIWLSMVHSEDLPRVRNAATLTQDGVYFAEALECRMLHYADKHPIWVEVSSQVLLDPVDGHPMQLSILRDITNLKQSELEAIRKKQEAEQSSLSKSQFLANMSHEIRTPINAILGMLALLHNTALNVRQADYVGKAEGATQGLLGLINDILDFSKADAGKMRLESQPFSLEALLRNLAVVLSSNTKNKKIDVLFDIDPRLPGVLMGDALRLQQVLINLGGNAIKFTDAGQVIVALALRESTAEGVVVDFSVQDSGIGIAPEHQALIFEAFSQAEASTTRRFGGTGLGLAISKHLIELMGGTLALESAPGVGTTFRFQAFFATPLEIPAALCAPERPGVPHQKRVLVVDDNPHAIRLLRQMMDELGWPADCFTSGAQALAHLQSAPAKGAEAFAYSLALIDWQMPEMDGWALAQGLRAVASQAAGAPLLVLMMSANGRQDLALRSEDEEALVDGFLVKPLTRAMILDTVLEASAERPGVRKLATARTSKRQLAGMRILVVEDNLLNQQVAEELLSHEGALVAMAANGKLAVEAVQSAKPQFDVVLMDIQMPVMDGYQATAEIRNRLGLADLPIIAMTANAMASDRAACMAAGMNEHIGKPFDMGTLVSLLIRCTGFLAPAGAEVQTHLAEGVQEATLPEIPGLDLEAALARMSKSRALYRRAAQEFLKNLPALSENLQGLAGRQDRANTIATLHTLKGNAGTLGLTALATLAGQIEQSLSTQGAWDIPDQETEALQPLLASAATQLETASALLQPVGQASGPAGNAGTVAVPDNRPLMGLLQELSALAQSSDLQALDFFAQYRASFEAIPENFYSRLDAALQELDLATVHEVCRATIEEISRP